MGIYFQGTPWALPLTASSLAIFVILARRVLAPGPDRVVAVLWATCLVGFLSVTATPAGGYRPWSADRYFSGSVHVPGWSELSSLSETSLNVWLTVPLGLLTVLVVSRQGRPALALVALAAPFLAEAVQVIFPQLGRSAFLMQDVFLNVVGLGLGALLGGACIVALNRTGGASARAGCRRRGTRARSPRSRTGRTSR